MSAPFEVRALEGGTPGPSVEHDWVVTSDPVVQWIAEPADTYDSRYVTATFTAPGDVVPVSTERPSCGMGAVRAAPASREHVEIGPSSSDGTYTLEVRAVGADEAGPVATANFTVAADLDIDWISET
ncbi:MAG: hypothetical protein R2714_16460 [Microthrixaceae bacterium]